MLLAAGDPWLFALSVLPGLDAAVAVLALVQQNGPVHSAFEDFFGLRTSRLVGVRRPFYGNPRSIRTTAAATGPVLTVLSLRLPPAGADLNMAMPMPRYREAPISGGWKEPRCHPSLPPPAAPAPL